MRRGTDELDRTRTSSDGAGTHTLSVLWSQTVRDGRMSGSGNGAYTLRTFYPGHRTRGKDPRLPARTSWERPTGPLKNSIGSDFQLEHPSSPPPPPVTPYIQKWVLYSSIRASVWPGTAPAVAIGSQAPFLAGGRAIF